MPSRIDLLTQWCKQACLMEATARKPGNVHPSAQFVDLCYEDFIRSAKVASRPLVEAGERGVGPAVCEAIRQTQSSVQTNTNLGIALLIAPLAAVPLDQSLRTGIEGVLNSLDGDDARAIYQAIALAHPGGMGRVKEGDIADRPPEDLLWAMGIAADRDWIARQYVTGFCDLLDTAVPLLAQWRPDLDWETRVIHLQLECLSRWPDSLIARKCGTMVAVEASTRARTVLQAGWPDMERGRRMLEELDVWLRGDGHRRNPGTTADAVAATIFAALRDQQATFLDWK